MKKLSQKQQLRCQRLQRKRWHRRLRRKARKVTKQSSFDFPIPQIFQKKPELLKQYRDGHLFKPPTNFSLSDNREQAAAFIFALRRNLETIRRRPVAKQPFSIDIAAIEQLGTTGALILAAELDRRQRIAGKHLRPIDIDSWNPTVRRQLIELGFFDLLETKNLCRLTDDENSASEGMRLIRFETGINTNGHQANTLRQCLEDMAQTDLDSEKHLYAGLTEAMTNVTHHAYPRSRTRDVATLRGRWWLTGSYDPQSRRLKACILDQGVGIPSSLPQSKWWDRAKTFFSKMKIEGSDDASRIYAAMEIRRTSTGLSERGKGLEDIRKFVEKSKKGMLRIRSGYGEVSYELDNGYRCQNHEIPLMGTIIEWEVHR